MVWKKLFFFAAGWSVVAGMAWTFTVRERQDQEFAAFAYKPDPQMIDVINRVRSKSNNADLSESYKDLKVIDVHNHDGPLVEFVKPTWDEFYIDKIAIFGKVSEPGAMRDDQISWNAFKKDPNRYYPFFSGFDMHSAEGVNMARDNLEQGYFGMGEVVAASTYSPAVSKAAWKGRHAMDGHLDEIYSMCAEYKVPVLLHIDPLGGSQIAVLEEALHKHPDTHFILGHGNVGSSTDHVAVLRRLLERYPNLTIDFFAGYSLAAGEKELSSYIQLMEEYPNHFMLGSDSGYGLPSISYAYQAMYEVIDRLKPETAAKVAYENFERLMEEQPPTKTQIEKMRHLLALANVSIEGQPVNKRIAAERIYQLEKQLRELNKPQVSKKSFAGSMGEVPNQ